MSNDLPGIAVFVSGSGSNLQALIDASGSRKLEANIGLVVSNKSKAYGLVRAREAGIDCFVFKSKRYSSVQEASDKLLGVLREHKVDYIALAGYLKLLPEMIVKEYRNRILNIHPGSLPKYGGKGMYGHFVHEAVLANGENATAATVHLVDEVYDRGRTLESVSVPVMSDDTSETLAERVLKEEHELYWQVINKLIRGKYDFDN